MTIKRKNTQPSNVTPGARHESPPIDITPVGEMPMFLAILAYGRSGTGKTTFLSTFPKPILLLDIREKGTDSIANVEGVQVAKIETFQQLIDVYWYLKRGKHPYKTVGIDQVTALQDLAIAQAKKEDGKDASSPISKRDWGNAAGLLKQWFFNYRDLIDDNMHVAFLGHDRTTESEDTEEEQLDPSVGVRLMPSVAGTLYGMVKVIGNTFIRETFKVVDKRRVREVEYAMRLGPHAYYTTKTRSPVGVTAPNVLVNPTYDKVVAVIKGTYSEQATTTKQRK